MRQSTIPNKKKKLTKSKGEICCNDQNYTFFQRSGASVALRIL
jgi:hypothetical protein